MFYTVEEARLMLKMNIENRGIKQCNLADELGVTRAFVSDALKGKTNVTGKLLNYLGLERITVYRRIIAKSDQAE